MSNHEITIDFEPIINAINTAFEAIGEFAETIAGIAQPRPQVEVRELRDLSREHNLDRVERGEATVRRVDGSLVAEWGGEELTRFKEYANE